jgi:hypothetical protein
MPTLAKILEALTFIVEEDTSQPVTADVIIRAGAIAIVLERLRDLLASGDVALLSRIDREAALTNAVAAGMAQGSTDHDYNGEALEAKAIALLQLEPNP